MGARELDRVYEWLGLRGWFPLGIFFVSHLVGILRSFMFLGNAMTSWTPEFNCTNGESVNSTLSLTLTSCSCSPEERHFSVPRSHTFVAEWDVVCERAPLKYLTETFFYLGCILACCFVGYLSDNFGRRYVIIAAALLGAVVGVQAAWLPNLATYVAARFLLGVAYTGMLTISTYKSEIFPAKWRFIAVNCDFSFIYGSLLLPLMSHYVSNWRHLCIIMYSLNILVVISFFFLPESPTWLIRKGRNAEAFNILQNAATARGKSISASTFEKVVIDDPIVNNNNDTIDDGIVDPSSAFKAERLHVNEISFNESSTSVNSKSTEGFKKALKSRVYLISLLGCGLIWSYNGFVYIGITFSYGTLSGHRLVNFFLNQVVGIPAKAVGICFSHFCRRRPVMMFMYAIVCCLYGSIAILRSLVGNVDTEMPVYRRIINIALLCCLHINWAPCSLYMQEVFPTLVRGRSYLVACFCGRILAVAASFFPHLQQHHPLILEIVLAIVGFSLVVYIIFIPETFREPLPQTLSDQRRMWEKTRLCGRKLNRGRRREKGQHSEEEEQPMKHSDLVASPATQ